MTNLSPETDIDEKPMPTLTPLPLKNASLQSIQADIRRTINELQSHQQRLEDYSNALKKTAAQMLRDIG